MTPPPPEKGELVGTTAIHRVMGKPSNDFKREQRKGETEKQLRKKRRGDEMGGDGWGGK